MAKKSKSSDQGPGGIKGFLTKAGSSFYKGGLVAKEWSWWLAKKSGKVGIVVATTSIVVLMPLVFEIAREGQVSLSLFFSFLPCAFHVLVLLFRGKISLNTLICGIKQYFDLLMQ